MIKKLKFFSSSKGASFNKELNAIHKECKAPFIAHLTIKYPTLSILDAEEIYDDAILALYQNVKEGKLKELTCSLPPNTPLCVRNNQAFHIQEILPYPTAFGEVNQ